MSSSTLNRFAPQALGILRIMAALLFLAHGTQKILGFPVAPQSGFPPAFTMYWFAGVIELVTGTLLALGLFTRPAAFLAAGLAAAAYWIGHAPRSFYPLLNGGDAAVLYCFVFLYLVFAGAGAFSIDGARSRN